MLMAEGTEEAGRRSVGGASAGAGATSSASDGSPLTVICRGFHEGPICGLTICWQVPLAVTISEADGSLRVWAYGEQDCRLRKAFPDRLFGAALHPSGLQLLVGLPHCIRLYHLLAQ